MCNISVYIHYKHSDICWEKQLYWKLLYYVWDYQFSYCLQNWSLQSEDFCMKVLPSILNWVSGKQKLGTQWTDNSLASVEWKSTTPNFTQIYSSGVLLLILFKSFFAKNYRENTENVTRSKKFILKQKQTFLSHIPYPHRKFSYPLQN